MNYNLNFKKKALDDIRKTKRKHIRLKIHPTIGIGNPEQLKPHLSGVISNFQQ